MYYRPTQPFLANTSPFGTASAAAPDAITNPPNQSFQVPTEPSLSVPIGSLGGCGCGCNGAPGGCGSSTVGGSLAGLGNAGRRGLGFTDDYLTTMGLGMFALVGLGAWWLLKD